MVAKYLWLRELYVAIANFDPTALNPGYERENPEVVDDGLPRFEAEVARASAVMRRGHRPPR